MRPRAVFYGIVPFRSRNAQQVFFQRAYVRVDRHPVVVQDHQQIGIGRPGVVQSFESQPPGQRSVADHSHRMPPLAAQGRRRRDAQRRRNGGRGMPSPERVVSALLHLRESAQPVQLAVHPETVAAAGDDLVGIGLMAHVPDQLVVRRIEHVMQRGGQLDDAETRSQMAGIQRELLDDEPTQLVAVADQFLLRKFPQIGRRIDPVEVFVG